MKPSLALILVLFSSPTLPAQGTAAFTLQTELTPVYHPGDDIWGSTVAIDADRAMVSSGFSITSFLLLEGGWQFEQELVPTDPTGKPIGGPIALDGDTVVIGYFADATAGDFAGCVRAFERRDDGWAQTQKLVPDDLVRYDWFGRSLALSGDTLLVGAPRQDGRTGSVYVFSRKNGSWAQTDKLVSSQPFAWAQFGSSVALDGRHALVGAAADPNRTGSTPGSVHAFMRRGGAWIETQVFQSSAPEGSDNFGASLALDGGTALIGAPARDWTAARKAYVFRLRKGRWIEDAVLQPTDPLEYRRFGEAVALRDGTALADGTYLSSTSLLTAVCVFDEVDGNWTPTQTLHPPDGSRFSPGLALGDSRALIGTVGSSILYELESTAGLLRALAEVIGEDSLPRGIQRALLARLTAAEFSLARGKQTASCKQLDAFIRQVHALDGRRIPSESAAEYLDFANGIRAHLGCP